MALAHGLVEILEIGSLESGVPVCLHSDGSVATHFTLAHADGELIPIEEIEFSLLQTFKDLSPEVKIRFRSMAWVGEGFSFEHARSRAVSETMAVENRLVMTLEMKRPSAFGVFSSFLKGKTKNQGLAQDLARRLEPHVTEFRALSRLGLTPEPITDEADLRSLYHDPEKPVVLTSYGLDLGKECVGVLKLQRLGTHMLSHLDLALIREQLPLPFEIHFAAQKLTPTEAQFHLSRRSKQESTGSGAVSNAKYQEAEMALEEIELNGKELFNFELSIMLRRGSEAELRSSLSKAQLELKRLGDFRQETYGALSAYLATLPGSEFHFTILEKDELMGCFAPVIARADSEVPSQAPGAMAYHRQDSSLSMLDVFHPSYESYSGVIIGQPGRGKSVFANTLLRCILRNENARVILVDVRGSHVRTTTKLGGTVNNVRLDVPSGINPLAKLSAKSSKYEREIAATFVKQLMLNDDEADLPVKESFLVEEAVQAFADSEPKKPSIDAFLSFARERLPRPEHLARWGKDSLHGNVFAEKSVEEQGAKLTYYNFEQIMTATNRSVATAVVAAVMAQFSYELIKKGEDENLYFFFDETPFFVQHCFTSLKLLIKNVRKLNGSLFLIAQDHGDLVVGDDTSLLSNAATKVLFSIDGKHEQYRERLKLSEKDMATLAQLRGEKGEYSKFLLVDGLGSRVGVLRLSREEYLFSSTSATDQTRITALKNAVPGLTEIDAIELLSLLPKRSSKKEVTV